MISSFFFLFFITNALPEKIDFKLPNKIILISQDENLNHYKILIDRKEKTLIKKKIEKSDISENAILKSFFLKNKPEIFEEEELNLEEYQQEMHELGKKSTFFKEDYNKNMSYYYFKYKFINYTQCFYYDKTVDHELFSLMELIVSPEFQANYSTKTNSSEFLYQGKKFELFVENSKIKSINIGQKRALYFINDQNNDDIENEIPLSECIYYNLTSLSPENRYNLKLNEKETDEVYSHYKNRFLSQYETLLATTPQTFLFSYGFKFCGNWCGPNYGGFNDEKCKEICKKNLDTPSDECKKCKPPINAVDEVCMLHDFCCERTQIINKNICGNDYNSYDCECHSSMIKNLAKLKWNLFAECNFVEKVMMEIVFSFLNCRCKFTAVFESVLNLGNESFTSDHDKCVPSFMCKT